MEEDGIFKCRDCVKDMVDVMVLYCFGIVGYFFNWFGKVWLEVDVIIFEMGLFVNEGYED